MDLRKVKKLIELVEESGISELEVTSGDESVRIAMGGAQNQQMSVATASHVSASTPTTSSPGPAVALVEIRAPMSGTFYRAPSPEVEAYVQIGDRVAIDDVVCIIESMKMMHEIRAQQSGTVARIAIENGVPITDGDVLITLS
jgi:acetyl-CoA carboxylase biotin carboxyl carrier protein